MKVNAQLIYRRKQLAAELSYIFPVVEVKYDLLVQFLRALISVRLMNFALYLWRRHVRLELEQFLRGRQPF